MFEMVGELLAADACLLELVAGEQTTRRSA